VLNYIWLGLMLSAVVIGAFTGNLKDATDSAFAMAKGAVMEIALPLAGLMALWLGIMRLAEKSGMVRVLARLLRPVMTRLFPDVPPEHPAMGSMLMNMAANMLGLSNAATPLGLRAMKDLDSLNPRPGTATNAMCTFLAINTSSIQLIPLTVVGILAVNRSVNASAIIGPAFMASMIATVCAIIAVKFFERLPAFRLPPVTPVEGVTTAAETKSDSTQASEEFSAKPLAAWGALLLAAYFIFFAWLFFGWLIFPKDFTFVPFDLPHDGAVVRVIKTVSMLAIPMMLTFFPLYAAVRGIKVYEEFVEGAKEGFQVILRIIPNLVAILVAIGMFRGAGGIDLLTKWLAPVMSAMHFPAELLPMAIMRPLSGSGSLGVFTDLVIQYGPDHILSRTAGTMYGSTETTFYVLAVYFGAVGIRRTRHAVLAGLVADAAGLIASVVICKLVFG
jgi:spore maturation protein SpmA